ncbi:MAG: molecular chaperone DnaJ [Bacteroidetes bacterium]|nr:molecular chaperone DnaJ [Bacteroidota bacterium]MCL1968817.1 molecular chaperone DnaJ [Bacteroidota bacterium]
MKRDYYEILGVEKNASAEVLKKAYRKKAMEYHPDRNPGNKDAEEKFKEAAEAYDVLSSPEKRARYDQFGHAGMGGAASGGSSGFGVDFDLETIFERFGDLFGGHFGGGGFSGFSGGFGSGRRQQRQQVRKGANLRITVKLTLEEIAVNTEKKLKIKKQVVCQQCQGKGAINSADVVTCPKCNGSGQVIVQQRSMFGIMQQAVMCDQCHGEGTIINNPCPTCHGKGTVTGEEVVTVQIPAGVQDGMQLSMRDKGNAAPRGGINGDLIVAIEELPHDVFEHEGNNLYLNYYISFPQAALGGSVDIPTLDGKARIKLAAGTQGGQVLRLQGKGLPELNSHRKGDLIVNVNVWTPKTLSKEEREAVEKFLKSDNFIPKPGKNEKSFFNRVRQFFS